MESGLLRELCLWRLLAVDAFHIVQVEIGPSPIQAESKFSQTGPSPRKEFPRNRFGFPWISFGDILVDGTTRL
jgi:hypothetical protein